MKKIGIAGAGLVLAASGVVAVQAPAQAGALCEVGHICGDFTHKSPDEGYDDPIKVTCDWNDKSPVQWIAEGQSATCHDTDGFYVPSGKNITCTEQGWDT